MLCYGMLCYVILSYVDYKFMLQLLASKAFEPPKGAAESDLAGATSRAGCWYSLGGEQIWKTVAKGSVSSESVPLRGNTNNYVMLCYATQGSTRGGIAGISLARKRFGRPRGYTCI